MKPTTFIASVCAALLIGYLTGSYYTYSPISTTALVAATSASEVLMARIAYLETENKKINAHNNELIGQLTAQPSIATASSFTHTPIFSSASSQQNIQHLQSEYNVQKKNDEFIAWFDKHKNSPGFELGNEMKSRFDSEDVDQGWAQHQQNKLYDMFTQQKSLSGIALKSATCKTSQCQIKVSVVNQDNANETAMAISQAFDGEEMSQIIMDTNLKNGEAILYLSRYENGFEFE